MTLPVNWKTIKEVKFLIIHCSATPPLMDIGVKEIKQWHLARGFLDVGYHYVIRRNGAVEKGRADNVPGAHVVGVNHISLGICMVGGSKQGHVDIGEDNFTNEQWLALYRLVKDLKETYPKAGVIGHRDVPGVNKACPSFDVMSWYEMTFGPQ